MPLPRRKVILRRRPWRLQPSRFADPGESCARHNQLVLAVAVRFCLDGLILGS